ncbi:phage tail tape measure protein [Tropicimonas sp. S265A]|uniref:phage tail tape measure protein n=1 Tax=Tropicimonas sp. S265A TaxID=3415134 RepID=UPI003C7B1572
MSDFEELDGFEARMAELDQTLGEAAAVTATFDGELRRVRDGMVYTEREAASLGNSVGNGLRRAFDGVAFEGDKLSDSLKNVARSMADAAYNSAMKPVQQALGDTLTSGVNNLLSGVFGFSHGGAFTEGKVIPFARGGVVSSPTTFPMRGAAGLMGEAGPEAIMPLARGADGRLGVRMSESPGARPVQVVMNVSTPDVDSFRRSRSQLAADMGRALSLGQRNR